ncbi:MAG: metal-dependent hydrolase [Bacteroidales bacterium]|nr:metal-dependent hydrolase [Bacteroidales bacterium]
MDMKRMLVLALAVSLAACEKTPGPEEKEPTLQDFAKCFVTVLDSWYAHTGTVGTYEDVHVVPEDFTCTLGGVKYDRSAAFDVALQGFDALMDGYSMDIHVPVARDYAWPSGAYDEAEDFSGRFASLAFLQDFSRRQQAAAAEGGAWASSLSYEPQMLDDAGFSGACSLERGLLTLARWYRYLLNNGIAEDADVRMTDIPVSTDLYGAFLDVRVPYSQFYGTTVASLGEARNAGVLNLQLSGTAILSSVCVKARGEDSLSDDGMSFVNVNCNRQPVVLEEGRKTSVSVVLKPGTYDLDVTVCDREHRAMFLQLAGCTIAPGQETVVSETYVPADELLFYEGFDNFVWGGDYMGGTGAPGYAPDDAKITITSRRDATGYEEELVPVACDVPGTGFFQSNTWADVSGKTVGESHQMSDSYVASRNMGDYIYLFRCQERPGYLELGCANTARGALRLCGLPGNTGIGDVTISFDICPKHGITDDIEIALVNGGRFTGASVNGTARTLTAGNNYYRSNVGYHLVEKAALSVPADAGEVKKWTHIELTAANVTDGSLFQIQGSTSTTGNHGMYIDNIRITKGPEWPKKTMRLLYWNIQNGMWADQGSQYAHFIAWIKKYDPDICVWCEAKSNYATNSANGVGAAPYLPNNWGRLAEAYGHSYTAIGGYRDNFPQVVTAKFPITTLQKITEGSEPYKPVAHGAGHHRISVAGRDINIVTVHTWPQGYGYGVTGDEERAESSARHEGDYYRQYEMRSIVSKTVNDSRYASQEHWLMLGDFNSRSRLDNWYYKYDEASTLLITQDVVLEQTKLLDVMANCYPGDFVSSTHGNARIDYIYASASMYGSIVNATTLIDLWTTAYNTGISTFWYPSDHRPLLVDFEF